jgi:2-keto-4-pentenoate hydratase
MLSEPGADDDVRDSDRFAGRATTVTTADDVSAASPETRLAAPKVATIAADLFEAFETGVAIDPPTTAHPDLGVADAYRIQRDLLAHHARAGRRIVGRKIGLTSLAMQRQLGIDSPDFGSILDTHVFAAGHTVSRSGLRMIAPKLEPEVAVVLERQLSGPGVTAEDVRDATDEVVAVMELIDSRVRDWRIGLADTISDNASCFGVVVGDRRRLDEVGDLSELPVAFSRDGSVEQQGTGSAVMGDPFEAVAWLANELARHGDALPGGELVLAGSFTAAIDATPGTYVSDFGPALGLASVKVTA